MDSFAIDRRTVIAPDTAMLCVTILVAPQLFGGAFPWSVVAISCLSVTCLGLALWVRRSDAPPAVDGVFVVMGIAWLWTCLQAVPLPSSVAQALAVGSVENAERLQGLAWADTTTFTVSYDPGSTHLQILIGISILSVFVAARLGGTSGLKPIAAVTAVSAVLMGLVGFAHEAAGVNALFGVYTPRFTLIRMLAPLMNANHLGGFSLTGALISAGLAAQTESRRPRHAWIAASVFCTTVVVWTVSRGAIGALLFGFTALAAWLASRGRSRGREAAIRVAVAGAVIAGVAAFVALESVLQRFEKEGLDKLVVAARGLQLLDGSAWFLGVGRGAFSSAFVTLEGSTDRYTHPENLVVQWITEWGMPVAILLLAVLVAALWKRFRSAEEPLTAAVCIAIFALSLQNLVDFSLEMAGVVVVVAALFGALLPLERAREPSRSRALWLASAAVFASIALVLGPRVVGGDTQSIVDRLTQYMRVDDEARFEATLRRGLALHPGEPAIALLAAAYAGAKRHPDAARWLSVVMDEAPEWATPHSIAAQWLASEGKIDQALLEIRHAEQRRAGSGYEVACRLLTRFPRMEYVERATPPGDEGVPFLNRTIATCGRLPAELRAEIDAAILQTEPTHAAAVLREVQRLAARERLADASTLLERSLEHNEDDVNLWVALVRVHLQNGDPEQARSVWKGAASRGLNSATLSEAQARIEAGLGESDAMRATLTRLRGQSRGDTSLVARSFMLEAELEASRGNIDEALAAYEAADVARPATGALLQAAKLALNAGRPTYARRAYRTLCARQPDGWACTQEAQLSNERREPPAIRAVP